MYSVEVAGIEEVDMSALEFPQVAVYNRPDDYPDHAVARVLDNGKPTNIIIKADVPEVLLENIRRNTNMIWIPRGAEDVLSLTGVFL